MSDLNITVKPTKYGVTALPEDDIDGYPWSISVEYRGRGKWAVMHHGYCLGIDGEWDHEPRPGSREDDWLTKYRFDLDDALARAKAALPSVRVNGMTVADVIARRAARKAAAE